MYKFFFYTEESTVGAERRVAVISGPESPELRPLRGSDRAGAGHPDSRVLFGASVQQMQNCFFFCEDLVLERLL
jgi:hypothetical protein